MTNFAKVLTSSICFTPIILLFELAFLSLLGAIGELGMVLSPPKSKLALLALLALPTFLSLNLSCKRVAPEFIFVPVVKFVEDPLLLLCVLLDIPEAGDSERGEGLLLLPTPVLSSI